MLYVILAEAAIELVPEEIAQHPQVQRDAKRLGKKAQEMLLDSSRHWEAMAALDERQKRGRPDIAHFCLLTAMESATGKSGGLRVLVHTRNDELVRISPDTRLPRVYDRFTGLIEDAYGKKTIKTKDGKELLAIETHYPLEKVLSEVPKETKKIVLDPEGEKLGLAALCEKFSAHGDLCVVVGGFAHGKFRNSSALAGIEKISLSALELAAWTALGMAVFSYEYGGKGQGS